MTIITINDVRVRTFGQTRLIPGDNQVTKEVLDDLLKHPTFQDKLAKGSISVEAPAKPYVPTPDPAKETETPKTSTAKGK